MPDMNIELKSALSELKSAINNFAPKESVEKLQTQVDAIDEKVAKKHIGDSQAPAFVEKLKEDEGFQRLLHDRRQCVRLGDRPVSDVGATHRHTWPLANTHTSVCTRE